MRRLESAFLDRASQFRRLPLVAIDAERMGEIAQAVETFKVNSERKAREDAEAPVCQLSFNR